MDSIRRRLNVAFVAMAAGPLLLTGVLLTWMSYRIQKEAALHGQAQVCEKAAIQIMDYFHSIEDELNLSVHMSAVMKQGRKRQVDILSRIRSGRNVRHVDVFDELALLNREGRKIARVSRDTIYRNPGLGDRSMEKEFIRPLRNGKVYYGPVSMDSRTGEPFLIMGLPIVEARTGLTEGVLTARVRLRDIRTYIDHMAKMHFAEAGDVYVLDASGRVIAHRDPSIVLKGTSFNPPRRDGIHTGVTGGKVVLAGKEVTFHGLRLYVVTEVPFVAAFRHTIRSLIIILLLLAVSLLGVILFGLLVKREIVQPIEQLTDTAAAISGGDLSRRYDHMGESELGVLARSINAMVEQLVSHIDSLKQLANERARLASAVEATADAVVITSGNGIIQYVNPAFESTTGYTRDEALGNHLHILDSGGHDESFYREIRETLKREGVWRGRLTSKRKDGQLYVEECTYTVIRNTSGEIVNNVAIRRDVTERIRLYSIAEEVTTMNNVGYVFSGVRHEISNYLFGMSSYLHRLTEKIDSLDNTAVKKCSNGALDALEKINYIFRCLKNFKFFEKIEPQDVSMTDLMDDFLSLVTEDIAKKGISITARVEPGAECCNTDPHALQQILLNLVTNAADALKGRKHPRIALCVSRTESMIRICIEDNGSGIQEDKLRNLFRPFNTTKVHGTGLGLVIVKTLAERMHGTVSIQSRINEGTKVELRIPAGAN